MLHAKPNSNSYSKSTGRVLAVILGASEFPHFPPFNNQKQKKRAFDESARQIASALRTVVENPKDCLNLFNACLTPIEILETVGEFIISRCAENRETDGVVTDIVFFYVGHGDGIGIEYSLLLRESKPSALFRTTTLCVADLIAHVRTVLEQDKHLIRQYYILDACHSGRARGAGTVVSGNKSVKSQGTHPRWGIAVLSSCNEQELSFVPNGWDRTLFSSAVIAAMTCPEEDKGLLRSCYPKGEMLSISQLRQIVMKWQGVRSPSNQTPPTPLVHVVDSTDGDVQDVPLFPNPMFMNGRRGRILYIEDDWFYARDRIAVAKDFGFEVEYASNARQAINAYEQNDFAAIVLDVRLPLPDDNSEPISEGGEFAGLFILKHLETALAEKRPHIWLLTGLERTRPLRDRISAHLSAIENLISIDKKREISLVHFAQILQAKIDGTQYHSMDD
jgi:CheY-like chemotaxis protein